jgi:hypothetical protein
MKPDKDVLRQLKRFAVLLAAPILLAACGDDAWIGPDASALPSPPPPQLGKAEGVYAGTVTGAPSGASAFEALVLENDDIWVLYGADLGSVFSVYGFIQGSGTSTNGAYASNTARDYGYDPAVDSSISATYDLSAQTIAGSLSSSGATVSFAGGPIPGSAYNYNTAASLDSASGAWTAQTLDGDYLAINISANGSLGFIGDSGCSGTGSVTPRASGKNVFDISVRFANNSACYLPNETATGIGIVYPLAETGQSELLVAVTNSAKTLGIAAFGIR